MLYFPMVLSPGMLNTASTTDIQNTLQLKIRELLLKFIACSPTVILKMYTFSGEHIRN